jgi:voltage-gated potassium channel
MTLREKLYHIVFMTYTKAAKRFDIWLLWTILFAVVVVMLESVPELGLRYKREFFTIEWILTIIFTLEFLLRIWISPKPFKYIFSFWGLIDFLSILPTYLDLILSGYHYLLVVRVFRLLRIFRILKLVRFSSEARNLVQALRSSMYKISVFFITVLSIVTFMGTIMYVVEGGKEGFNSIPQSIYWAIVTVTTVGYGDIVPHTVMGKFISSIAMIIGYAMIVVPTGIVTVEMSKSASKPKKCANCNQKNDAKANFCSTCGRSLNVETNG